MIAQLSISHVISCRGVVAPLGIQPCQSPASSSNGVKCLKAFKTGLMQVLGWCLVIKAAFTISTFHFPSGRMIPPIMPPGQRLAQIAAHGSQALLGRPGVFGPWLKVGAPSTRNGWTSSTVRSS